MNKSLSWGGYCFPFLIQNLLCLVLLQNAFANEPIPEPLTLKYALSRADLNTSPEIMRYSAQQQLARAEQDMALSELGVFVAINGRLRYVEPSPLLPADMTNDSEITLDISKRLYDFGRSHANIEASKQNLASIHALYTDYVSKRMVAILQAYLNVLLADIVYEHANEAMSVDYVALDKMRSRFELKQISDIELLEVENNYRRSRREQIRAVSDQRNTRHRLAQLLQANSLPNTLETPDFKQVHFLSIARELPELETLYAIAYEHNPQLVSLAYKKNAMRFSRDAFQAEKYPVISAHLQAAEYGRELGGSDRYQAGIEFKVPLYQAGQENIKIKQASAKLLQIEADALRMRQEIEQQILALWLRISELKQQFSDPDFSIDYRDLYLERSRALYELEVTSDLGDAMVELTQAQLFKAQTVFQLAISWAKLDSLLGKLVNYYE